MKKLLAVAISALAISSTATANWYVQGDLGYSKTKFKDSNDNVSMTSFSPTLAVGYKINELRFALDYTYYGKDKFSYIESSIPDSPNTPVAHTQVNLNVKAQGFGVSTFYDFDLNSPIKPYIGFRLSLNDLKINGSYIGFSNGTRHDSASSQSYTKFGYGVLAGVSYPLINNLSLDGGVQLQRLASANNIKVNQYGMKIGLRYEF